VNDSERTLLKDALSQITYGDALVNFVRVGGASVRSDGFDGGSLPLFQIPPAFCL
jgi:hypothetical protein